MFKKLTLLFLSLILPTLTFKAVYSQETSKNELKIEVEPFSSERILLPSVDSEISEEKIKLLPPKEVIDAEKKAREQFKKAEEKKRRIEAIRKAEEEKRKQEAIRKAEEEKRKQEAIRKAEEEKRKQEAIRKAEEEK